MPYWVTPGHTQTSGQSRRCGCGGQGRGRPASGPELAGSLGQWPWLITLPVWFLFMSTTSYAGHIEPSDLAPLVQGSASSDSRSSLIQRLLCSVWLWPMVLTLVLGLYKLSQPELWRAELASWSAASRSVPQLFRLLGHVDTSSGAYYLFLHFWIKIFGDSIVALRLPSVLAMAGAAGCVALLGRRMFSSSAGVLAGLAFAVMPAVSRYAQEARSYAFTILGVTVATMLLLRALEPDHREHHPEAPRPTAHPRAPETPGTTRRRSLQHPLRGEAHGRPGGSSARTPTGPWGRRCAVGAGRTHSYPSTMPGRRIGPGSRPGHPRTDQGGRRIAELDSSDADRAATTVLDSTDSQVPAGSS
ncbi:hypothetical protein ABIA33_007701 [Streptacidiphilus sp. MAP12-16]|uniref:glycosyltransferase family 39 protein n=1 Tax=Streptacidiphilus sp. MAP12-16 TaxID=3156300 RepID=UPI003514AD92